MSKFFSMFIFLFANNFAGSSSKAADHAPVEESKAIVFVARISVKKNESIAPDRTRRITVQNGTFLLIFNSKKRTRVDIGTAKEPLKIMAGIRLGLLFWLYRNTNP